MQFLQKIKGLYYMPEKRMSEALRGNAIIRDFCSGVRMYSPRPIPDSVSQKRDSIVHYVRTKHCIGYGPEMLFINTAE